MNGLRHERVKLIYEITKLTERLLESKKTNKKHCASDTIAQNNKHYAMS